MLPPGPYQIRSSILSTALNKGGSAYLPIDIPDFRKPAHALGSLVLGRAGDRESVPAGLPFRPTPDRGSSDRTCCG